MSLSCNIDKLKTTHEIVICDSGISGSAHKELFRIKEEAYLILSEGCNIFGAISEVLNSFNFSSGNRISKIHIAMNWKNLVQVSLWQASEPKTGDVFTLLRNIGVTSEDLQPFRTSDINDIFPFLYYGKRFDILRKVCHAAKKQMENYLSGHSIQVVCHLAEEDTKRIVASSL